MSFVGAVQIAGVASATEAAMLEEVGVDFIGFPLRLGYHTPDTSEAEAKEIEPLVDAFITDTFDPKTGATGATGIPHDWSVSARIARSVTKPLILAGGLHPSNVYEAIMQVRPAAVDAHTGVEDSAKAKSRSLTTEFLSEARKAFAQLGMVGRKPAIS